MLINNLVFLLLGAVFGLLLSLAGATTFDFYAKLFLFKDPQLAQVIASAVLVSAVGIWLIRRFRVQALMTGEPIQFESKPMQKHLVLGSLLFGMGWGLTGSCPGSAPAMLGEGKLIILPVLMGVLAGTWLYGRWVSVPRKAMAESRPASSMG